MADIAPPLPSSPPPTLPPSLAAPGSPTILAVQKFQGLSLEPPTRDIVEVGSDGDAEAVTREEEWVTKKKTELTTTRQIETRVKRQVVLEDGKVVEDSGPIVSTNTTEDTEKQESHSTERRNLGDPDTVDGPEALENVGGPLEIVSPSGIGSNMVQTIVARPDGLVREVKEKKVVSREEVKELLETEDVHYLGAFSDEAYVKAVSSGVENIEPILLSPEAKKQLIPIGTRVVHQSTKTHKTVDTEDTDLKCLAQPDGTLVTEKKKTTEHEELFDEDLPDEDDKSTGSRERIDHKESSQRFFKQSDEQTVELVADGKVIGKEMRYVAEAQEMERDGPPENPSDWDSLSDRVRKARRQGKTLLQQQREAALLGDRKDALTKRPLDFEKEEETRKLETSKWLESHFGSESHSSKESRDDDDDDDGDDVEPTKRTFFNVTIKSNNSPTAPPPPPIKPIKSVASANHQIHHNNVNNYNSNKLASPAKVFIPEREPPSVNQKTKYFQGITDWSERRESTPRVFANKAFHDELKGTIEKNRLAKMTHSRPSKEDLRYVQSGNDDYARRYEHPSRDERRFRRNSKDDSDDSRNIKVQKEDLGYLSGSRNDLRYRKNSQDDVEKYNTRGKTNGHLHREDSGYIKDSREDLRYYRGGIREEQFIRDAKQASIQRDDSAYVSSSTYFTTPRSPKVSKPHLLRTPDSGIRSPSPSQIIDTDDVRPTVPQRKRAIERKMKMTHQNGVDSPMLQREEPPPDYSPPPRSRSISPGPHSPFHQHQLNGDRDGSGSSKKSFQRTRFASESRLSPSVQPSAPAPTKPNKVGSVIGNSLRKLVGKIRSASAERKLKLKAKRSPSPQKQLNQHNQNHVNGSSTYQQYNVIDGHIGQQPSTPPTSQGNRDRETSVISGSGRRERTLDRRGSSDVDMVSPKQRYYLGEDPYGGSIYGRENKYDGMQRQPQRIPSRKLRPDDEIYQPTRIIPSQQHPQMNSSTLGRFSKSTNRLLSPQPISNSGISHPHDMYRNVQTLPRKLEHRPSHASSTINVSIVNTVQPTQNTGPAKPARTYKSLNRSKSFNVHGLNGTNDPSPIYMEKLNRNYSSSLYKSNPHLNESGPQLKSPSIVNLISRSQRDLTRIDPKDEFVSRKHYQSSQEERRHNGINNNNNYMNGNGNYVTNGGSDKKTIFLKGLQEQAPELYKTLHGGGEDDQTQATTPIRNGQITNYQRFSVDRNGNRERESSLGSRSPLTINKDTASIVRRGSSSTEDYSETYKFTTKSDDPRRPSVTNTVQSFSKKTIPSKNGRSKETIESSEMKSVTTSRYRGEPMSNLKYNAINERERTLRSSPGGVVIEVRGNSKK